MGKVYIIVVTYGDRWLYLKSLLEYAKDQKSVEIVLVNNSVKYDLLSHIGFFTSCKIKVIHSEENRGSAWGYKIGIEYCLQQQECDFIWLLDDDNLPAINCLEQLFAKFSAVSALKGDSQFALQCLRIKRKYLVRVANGEPVAWNFPQKNAFLGFHIGFLFTPIIRRLGMTKVNRGLIQIPCAPYGGLFFKKDLLDKMPLPDPRFFVYADDFNFTYNFTKANKPIYLTETAVIDDLAETWDSSKSKPLLPKVLRYDEPKIHNSVRNFVYFQVSQTTDSAFIFALNKNLYIIYLLLLSVFTGRVNYFVRFMDDVKRGIKGDFS